ncbi:MAG: OsmC family protein [Candidatus Helarchaeales archaeon]
MIIDYKKEVNDLVDEIQTHVHLELEKEMIFRCDMGIMKVEECYIDETNQEAIDKWGPDPTKLIAAAVLGCLSASFIFCLQKKKLTIEDFSGDATVVIARNEHDLLRIKEINVKLKPKTDDPAIKKRIEQCKKIFERYCTVTESVRAGIPVNVDIQSSE